MKILFAALAMPFPPTNGQQMRNWALLRALAEEGHEISLVSFVESRRPGQDKGEIERICRSVDLVPLPQGNGRTSYAARLRGLATLLPYGVWRHRSAAMTSAIQARLAAENCDLILCDDVYNFQNLPQPVMVPVLLNKHDITYVILRRYLAHERNPFKISYGWVEYSKVRRWEAQVCARSAAVLACSKRDLELLRQLSPATRFTLVPNVVDTSAYVPAGEGDTRTVLFVGALDWLPNQDAVEFFIHQVLPELRSLIPDVRFRVAGRNPSEGLRRQCSRASGVEFAGEVPDMRAEIARAAVCAVPLRIGSGTRLKILEAGAMGKAVVSTRMGAEGLDFVDRQEILLADEPREFANAVAELLHAPARRRAMGLSARRRVEQNYSLPALRATLREALEKPAGRDMGSRDEVVARMV